MHRFSPFLALGSALFLLVAVLAAGCKTQSSSSEGSVDGGPPAVIRLSDPGNAGIFAYAKREHLLEGELAKTNAKIEWVPGGGSFSASFEAMNSGAINASGGAVSPIVGALGHRLPFAIYAVANPSGTKRAGIIVPASSTARSLRDLVGKRVAVNLAAHGDYILLKALAHEGVPLDQVERVNVQPPDAAAAFASGKLDGWSTFGVYFSTAVRNGAHVLATEDQIESDDVNVLSANRATLEASPAAFKTIVRVAQELTELAHRSPEKFQNVFTDKGPTALSGDELRIAIEETRVTPGFHLPREVDRARIGNVVKVLYDNKSIDRQFSIDQVVFDLDKSGNI